MSTFYDIMQLCEKTTKEAVEEMQPEIDKCVNKVFELVLEICNARKELAMTNRDMFDRVFGITLETTGSNCAGIKCPNVTSCKHCVYHNFWEREYTGRKPLQFRKEELYDPHMSERTVLAKFALWLANRGYVAIDTTFKQYRDRTGEIISITDVVNLFYNSLRKGEI